MPDKERILEVLAGLTGPDGKNSLSPFNGLSDIIISGDAVTFSIAIDPRQAMVLEPLRDAAEKKVASLPDVAQVRVTLTSDSEISFDANRPSAFPPIASKSIGPKARAAQTRQSVPGVKQIIAVASGKGGVGKSTTACNLAFALSQTGLKVGILDADIYGPSLPKLLGITQKPKILDNKMLEPVQAYGLQVMSIGFMVDDDKALIWRGPMVMSAVQQMLREVAWDLDLLVVDMPPGTGDAHLTLTQAVPLAGAIIVSTPQDLALIDARRGLAMFQRVEVPVLGIIENMSYFLCPSCGTRSDIFGHGGAREEAQKLNVPFLGEIPLHIMIRQASDHGVPVMIHAPESVHAGVYKDIAKKIITRLKGTY